VAIGIQHSTVDGIIYKAWCRTTHVNDWLAIKPFVAQIRLNTNNAKLFCEFESLAKKWANSAEAVHL